MIPMKHEVRTAGYGFFMLFNTTMTLIAKVELENRLDITILLFCIDSEGEEGVNMPVLVCIVINVRVV